MSVSPVFRGGFLVGLLFWLPLAPSRAQSPEYRAAYSYAYAGSGLNYSSGDAEIFALQLAKFGPGALDRFIKAMAYGYAGSGLDMNKAASIQFGLKVVACPGGLDEFVTAKGYAYGGSGLNLNTADAIRVATRISQAGPGGLELFKKVRSEHYSSSEAERTRLALESLPYRGYASGTGDGNGPPRSGTVRGTGNGGPPGTPISI